jgi:hypothetical protein
MQHCNFKRDVNRMNLCLKHAKENLKEKQFYLLLSNNNKINK